jgi:hypothetical protein
MHSTNTKEAMPSEEYQTTDSYAAPRLDRQLLVQPSDGAPRFEASGRYLDDQAPARTINVLHVPGVSPGSRSIAHGPQPPHTFLFSRLSPELSLLWL